jgi:hypothetical protein
MQSTRILKTAWLITWEWAGDHARVDEAKRVAAVLNYRWGGDKVRELVEQLYAAIEYNAWDKAGVAQNNRSNPYPARFGNLDNNIPWLGEVHCGHNPWLHARRVRNFQVVIEDDGTKQTRWEEIPRPKLPKDSFP